MQRVFQQGTRDFGHTLSPSSDNPYGRTPYANWFQRRYSDVVPANHLLSMILNNQGGEADFAPGAEGAMKSFMSDGTGRGFGTGTAGASQNLGSLNDLLNSFMDKNTANLSPDQMAMLGGLGDDPRSQMALINAQLSGGMGANPLASKYVNQVGDLYAGRVLRRPSRQGPGDQRHVLQQLHEEVQHGRALDAGGRRTSTRPRLMTTRRCALNQTDRRALTRRRWRFWVAS